MSEFIKWSKTPHWDTVRLRVTQKLDGTNAQILIQEFTNSGMLGHGGKSSGDYVIHAGSRTRWLGSETRTQKKGKGGISYERVTIDDNHGFYKWVMDNKEELTEKLGPGRYYGEWCGPGIQNGENLTERALFLFNPPKNCENLPNGVHLVPQLFDGVVNLEEVGLEIHQIRHFLNDSCTMIQDELLKKELTVKPEGMIIQIDSQRYKLRFKE